MTYQERLTPWLTLGLGETASGQICPFCDGGEHHEKSFSVTKKEDGVVVFKCHRNKCGKGGAVRPDGVPMILVHTKTKEHKEFTDPTVALTSLQIAFFEKMYGLKESEVKEFRWVPDRKAIWFPVYGPDGSFRGQVVRRYSDKQIWAYKASKDQRGPLIAWYKGPKGSSDNNVVIVEDILSAIKFSRYHNAVALLGTSMSHDMILEIMQWSRFQYLCLDKDALTKAIELANRWAHLLKIQIRECSKDPKYWDDTQLEKIDEKAVPF